MAGLQAVVSWMAQAPGKRSALLMLATRLAGPMLCLRGLYSAYFRPRSFVISLPRIPIMSSALAKAFSGLAGATTPTLGCPSALALALLSGPAAAQASERSWHVTAYRGRWVDADLLEIPGFAVTGEVKAQDAYFVG